MTETLNVDICVIGAGSGGLSVAAGASQLGASVVLIEKARMGGDCLNFGCVPSKAMLAAAHAAETVRSAGRFGVRTGEPEIDSGGVYDHIKGVIAAIEPNDSVERFEGMGVTVIKGEGRFTGRGEVEVGDFSNYGIGAKVTQDPVRFTGPTGVAAGNYFITARRVVVATGSSPFVPPVPGLEDAGYYTNETVFDADALPGHLIVIGGGPFGMEMAQAHRQLGAKVTVLEMFSIMPKDDPELVDVVRRQLIGEGIEIFEGAAVKSAEKTATGVRVSYETGDGEVASVEGSHILAAAGRRPNVGGLRLEEAGIKYSPKGIEVDARLRTSNKRVFAIGDVTGGMQFTHVAGYHAGVVIKNALFRWPAKANTRAVPWVTYTAPELAQVGLTEAEAMAGAGKAGGDISILRWPYHENDRAQAEKTTGGMVKAVVTAKGRILGCGIAGARAGELIQTWVLAMDQKIKIGALAQMVVPYPTLGEVSKRAAGSFYTASLFSERTRKIVHFLSRFG